MNLLEIQKGFQKFDKNGDGHITVEELQEARKKFEEENSADHAKDMIKDVDRNGNMLFLKKKGIAVSHLNSISVGVGVGKEFV